MQDVEDSDLSTSGRKGRQVTVAPSDLVEGRSLPLPIEGEVESVSVAYVVESNGNIQFLSQDSDYGVENGNVVWNGGDRTQDRYAVFFVE